MSSTSPKSSRALARTSLLRLGVVLATVLAWLGVSAVARADVTSDVQLRMPAIEPHDGSVPLALRAASVVSLVQSLALEGVIANEYPQGDVRSAFDSAIWEEVNVEHDPLYCYGPGCQLTFVAVSQQRDSVRGAPVLPSVKFINQLGPFPAALLAYLITPAKFGAISYRFGLVRAMGGPAFGLHVRW